MINTFTSSVIRTNTDTLHLLSPTNVISTSEYPGIFQPSANPLEPSLSSAGITIGVSTYLKIIPVKFPANTEPRMLVVGWCEYGGEPTKKYIPFTLWEGQLTNAGTDGSNPLLAEGLLYSVALPVSSVNTPAKIISCDPELFSGDKVPPGGILLDALGAKFITFYFQSSPPNVQCNVLYGSI